MNGVQYINEWQINSLMNCNKELHQLQYVNIYKRQKYTAQWIRNIFVTSPGWLELDSKYSKFSVSFLFQNTGLSAWNLECPSEWWIGFLTKNLVHKELEGYVWMKDQFISFCLIIIDYYECLFSNYLKKAPSDTILD